MNKTSNSLNYTSFFLGKTPFSLTTEKNVLTDKIYQIQKYENVKQICGGEFSIMCSTYENELYYYEKNVCQTGKKIVLPKQHVIKKIAHGYDIGLILTESGSVYSIGTYNNDGQLPFKDPDSIEAAKIYLISWFVENKITIQDIACGSMNNIYLSCDNIVFANGYNTNLQLCCTTNPNAPYPCKIAVGATRIFCSPHTLHYFYTTLDNKLMVVGNNENGQCGLGNKDKIHKPAQVPDIEAGEVENICSVTNLTTVLLRNGKLLVCARKKMFPEDKTDSYRFRSVPSLEKFFFISVASGTNFTVALTEQNQVYTFGSSSFCNHTQNVVSPKKIESSILTKSLRYDLNTSLSACFFYPKLDMGVSSNSDFLILYETGKFSDYSIKNIKVHKSFLECRLGQRPIKEIEQILENYTEKEINIFLKWVYSSAIENYALIVEICKKLKIEQLYKANFNQDLFALYKDDDSKNFDLIVNEDQDEDEENEEGNYEEIPVHKYVLYARSGLFRDMFDTIDENSTSVTDYSGKTVESLEILIKYFYTANIELTADDDPQLIIEELIDAKEYYQLNKLSNINYLLNNLKKQFNIN
ncbi:hypothetical protein M0813_08660 [Anaeramoeba flamelloides]|uniref:BTB domain-containing protein n=1 Tax=Anaeramoeba flamelloides TaxID=1746091 RepID=A0ABQ8X7F9_9EUKA|nr:hypothetical protein M0813_08660 [Anaeramoeba flamelloides]